MGHSLGQSCCPEPWCPQLLHRASIPGELFCALLPDQAAPLDDSPALQWILVELVACVAAGWEFTSPPRRKGEGGLGTRLRKIIKLNL